MVPIFTGEHTLTVDGKGRVSIPADFRRVLAAGDPDRTPDRTPDRAVEMKILYGDHLDRRLHFYTMSAFAQIQADILALPRGSEARNMASRLILGQSVTAEMDRDGRMVIPQKQREKIGLTEGKVYFSGLGEFFEVWNAETWAETEGAETKAWLEDKPRGFDPLILLQPGGS